MEGGTTYSYGTRVGNWWEDQECDDEKMKDFLGKKDNANLVMNITQKKFARSLKKVPITYSEDGLLRFGDKIMLHANKSKGYLSFDLGDKITT